jgi:stress response protein YsnF
VSAFTEQPPAADDAAQGGGRVLSESEVAEGGLLQERVIEIGEMREEAVVSKQAVVREELVIRKDVEERTEQVSESLRRTEIDVERIAPEPAEGGENSGGARAR